MSPVRLITRTAAVVAVAASFAACAHRPPPPAPTESTPPPPSYDRGPPPPPSNPYASPSGSVRSGPIPGTAQDFVVSAGDRVYFDFDQYIVRDEGRAVLDRQAAWLQRYPNIQVRIDGNCDERGTREYNLALGARRADSVKAYLVQHGIPSGRISTISYGKERPIDSGEGEEAGGRNRNAHTSVLGGGSVGER